MRISDPSTFARLAIPHAHTHGVSRRQLLKVGAATSAALAMTGMLAPLRAAAAAPGAGIPVPVAPNPDLFELRVYEVAVGSEPSTITDFNGASGGALVSGTGTGMTGGTSESLIFDTDMRFMQGVFRGTDGRMHQGAFTLI
jgi:hypothetical protein